MVLREFESKGAGSTAGESEGLDPRHGGVDIVSTVKRREAEVTLSGCAEAASWGSNHIRLIEQMVKEAPGVHAIRSLDPHVGSVLPAVDGEAS